MRCPRCAFKGEPLHGQCAICGYQFQKDTQISAGMAHITPRQSFSNTDQYTPVVNQYSSVFDQLSISNRHAAIQTLGPGRTLRQGRYSLLESITLPGSQQNQGMAWTAYDLQMSSRFVVLHEVKIPADVASTAAKREQAANLVAQRLNKLGEHPGLPNVIDLFKEKDTYFLVLLYPQGKTLARLLRQQSGALPEHKVAEYGWQLCDILNLLAEQQPPLVHGAINPETIIISEDGKQASLIHLPILPPKEAIGGTGTLTPPGYRAPEQVHGTITPSSDLYALAATLYHAVTGSDPLERPPVFYPPARRINPEISAAMEKILAQQLRLSATQRYASAFEMQQDLAALIESYPTQSSKSVARVHALDEAAQEAANEESLEIPRRSWLGVGIFIAVCALVLVGVTFFLVHQ